MALDKLKMKVITKLFDAGYTDEKSILAIGITELVALRLSPAENIAFDELQNAIKKNKVISYLSEVQEDVPKQSSSQSTYSGY